MGLGGKVALVTGSTSGIGLGIARALAREGAAVMLNGFGNAEAVGRLRAELAAANGVPVAYSGADMSRPAAIRALVAETAERLGGGPDIVVNNAGVQFTAPIEDFPEERWDSIVAINLSAAFHATKAAIPAMKRRGWGRVINVASAHGLVASAEKAAYVAAKHGVLGLTKVAAIELANSGVTVNAICPGWVRTPLVERQLMDRAEREGRDLAEVTAAMLAEKQPMRKFTTPEGLGALAVFLCSDAAETITGVPLSMDGGWLAQ